MTTPTLPASKLTVEDDGYHSDSSRSGCSRKRDHQQQQATTSKPSVTILPPYLRTPTDEPESIPDVYSAARRIACFLDALSRWFQPDLRLRITPKTLRSKHVQRLLRLATACRCVYNHETRLLRISPMARPVHNAITRFVSKTWKAMSDSGWLTAAEAEKTDIGVQTVKLARCNFRQGRQTRKSPASEKTPDAVINFGDQRSRANPSLVFEVGFTEGYEDLRSDVRQWLEKAGKKVQAVVLVDIQEDRVALRNHVRAKEVQARIADLLLRFGTEKAKDTHLGDHSDGGDMDIVEADAEDTDLGEISFTTESDESLYDAIGEQVTTDDWVGPNTAVLEIWSLDAGRAVHAVGPVVSFFPLLYSYSSLVDVVLAHPPSIRKPQPRN
jgi:hypothetical protein